MAKSQNSMGKISYHSENGNTEFEQVLQNKNGTLALLSDLQPLSDLFIGVPIPYPLAAIPDGCLAMNGQRFDKNRYPKLAQKYPEGTLPDLRGEFIRGWDNERGVDSERGLLSAQGDTIRNMTGFFNGSLHKHYSDGFTKGVPNKVYLDGVFGLNPNNHNIALSTVNITTVKDYADGINFDASRVVPTASENRPRNIAFHYICLAA
ncbi:phage tail protein [Rodentibacter trehalosifermentans]|nr:phage tail protein [Rodentibacter trehalosifermentans]